MPCHDFPADFGTILQAIYVVDFASDSQVVVQSIRASYLLLSSLLWIIPIIAWWKAYHVLLALDAGVNSSDGFISYNDLRMIHFFCVISTIPGSVTRCYHTAGFVSLMKLRSSLDALCISHAGGTTLPSPSEGAQVFRVSIGAPQWSMSSVITGYGNQQVEPSH